ncbi:hypothetical protein [Nocardioides sp. ChNu-99]|uniref:hypothetical protein n=1 Tax=Nocardioides sp. ChNu-99 TaxID=2839897 RepID=UPI0024067887|nr:hypothetical protein [Nocardioides sp. ChNu-99]MDF9715368.1 hypothetical protein [Nocardioides sp. ChNu-99]
MTQGAPVPPPLVRVAERLDVPLAELAALERCDPADLEALDTAIAMAQHAEDLEVRRSMRDAVRFVPAPLRRRVAAALFPADEPGDGRRDGAAEPGVQAEGA